jgi:hypothetical protein
LTPDEVIDNVNQPVQLLGGFGELLFRLTLGSRCFAEIIGNQDLCTKEPAMLFFMIEQSFFVIVQPGRVLRLKFLHPRFMFSLPFRDLAK